MEENIAYDHGPVPVLEKESGGTRRRGSPEKGQGGDLPDHVAENTRLAIRISGSETLAGMYAILLTSLGIAFPVSQYTSSSEDARMRDDFDIGFGLYVYVVALIFQLYITLSVKFHHKIKYDESGKTWHQEGNGHPPEVETSFGGTHQRKISGSKGEIYVIDNETKHAHTFSGGLRLPWHMWHKLAPSIYESKYGFNLFTRIGVLLFGASAVGLDVCRLVEYSRPINARCYTDALRALSAIRTLFFITQSLFLFIHHKVVFNFHHPLIKVGLLHLVSANIIAWVDMIAVTAIDVIALDQGHGSSVVHDASHSSDGFLSILHGANHTNVTAGIDDIDGIDMESMAYRLCLGQGNLAVTMSRYLGPLVIGYCLLAATVLYRMYISVGPEIYLTPQRKEVWEGGADSEYGGSFKCGRPNWGLVFGLPLFLATLGITCWYVYLDSHKEDPANLKTQGRIQTGCDLFWNIAILVALAPSFYFMQKLHYLDTTIGRLERILVGTLGGTYILLGFMTVASFMYIDDPELGGSAKMSVPGCILNLVQSAAVFAFCVDAWRRRLHNVDNNHGKDSVTFLILGNFSMWVITSFQWKSAFGSYLFYRRFGVLPWVLIINSTLPLAMFFRFMVCIILTDVLRRTYGMHVRRRLCLFSY